MNVTKQIENYMQPWQLEWAGWQDGGKCWKLKMKTNAFDVCGHGAYGDLTHISHWLPKSTILRGVDSVCNRTRFQAICTHCVCSCVWCRVYMGVWCDCVRVYHQLYQTNTHALARRQIRSKHYIYVLLFSEFYRVSVRESKGRERERERAI